MAQSGLIPKSFHFVFDDALETENTRKGRLPTTTYIARVLKNHMRAYTSLSVNIV